jgi:hypothetical protein
MSSSVQEAAAGEQQRAGGSCRCAGSVQRAGGSCRCEGSVKVVAADEQRAGGS